MIHRIARATFAIVAAGALTLGGPSSGAHGSTAVAGQWPAVPQQADAVGDVKLGVAVGPSFTPLGPTDRSDIAWVSVTPRGSDVVMQIKVKDLFVYARSDWHRGDRRSRTTMSQYGFASYGGITVHFRPDAKGTGLAVNYTRMHNPDNPYALETCPRQATVAISRVRDVIGVVLPMECATMYGNTDFDPAGVRAEFHSLGGYVATVGGREVARSQRLWADSLDLAVPRS